MAAFAELGVMGEIIRALDDGGWQLPTPIQQEAIPLILGGGDVLGAAETGTGKTGAFGIPVLQLMHEKLSSEPAPSASEESSAEGKAAPAAPKAAPKLQMSLEDKEPLFNVEPSGNQCSALSGAAWGGGRASAGILKGKYCFEVMCVEVAGTVRIGFSTMAGKYALGTCPNGFGYGGTAKKSNAGQFVDYGTKFGQGPACPLAS